MRFLQKEVLVLQALEGHLLFDQLRVAVSEFPN